MVCSIMPRSAGVSTTQSDAGSRLGEAHSAQISSSVKVLQRTQRRTDLSARAKAGGANIHCVCAAVDRCETACQISRWGQEFDLRSVHTGYSSAKWKNDNPTDPVKVRIRPFVLTVLQ